MRSASIFMPFTGIGRCEEEFFRPADRKQGKCPLRHAHQDDQFRSRAGRWLVHSGTKPRQYYGRGADNSGTEARPAIAPKRTFYIIYKKRVYFFPPKLKIFRKDCVTLQYCWTSHYLYLLWYSENGSSRRHYVSCCRSASKRLS